MSTIRGCEWDGQPRQKEPVAIVTHTDAGSGPGPILTAAHSEGDVCVVRPDQIGHFLQAHAGRPLIYYDAAVLHWTLYQHLRANSDTEGLRALWNCSRTHGLHDVALLDQLVRLGVDGNRPVDRRDLKDLATIETGLAVEDGRTPPLSDGQPSFAGGNFVIGSAPPACAILKIFNVLQSKTSMLTPKGEITQSATRFGPLALGLQVQGAIALAAASMPGLHLGCHASEKVLQACRSIIEGSCQVLLRDEEARRCLKTDSSDRIRFNKVGFPEIKERTSEVWRKSILGSLRGLHETAFDLSLAGGEEPISYHPEDWHCLSRCVKPLRAWADLLATCRLARHFRSDRPSTLYPRYELLPRISSWEPSLEQLRRICTGGVFVPPAGHIFIVVKLCDLELRSLAAVCQRHDNSSFMTEIFHHGRDPILETAAALAGFPTDAFRRLQTEDGEQYEHWLSVSRTFLFAAPRGLGEANTRELARQDYGLDLGLTDARDVHRKLLEVFPELGEYLQDDTFDVLAANRSTTADVLLSRIETSLGDVPSPPALRSRFLRFGRSPEKDHRLERTLRAFRDNSDAGQSPVGRRRCSPTLYKELFGRDVMTLTGRIRGRMLFGDARRASYLDLADDAAKSALYTLAAEGFRIAGFAGDEIVLEVLLSGDIFDQISRMRDLARRGVEEVFGSIPGRCEASMHASW